MPIHLIRNADPALEVMYNLELYLVVATVLIITGIVHFGGGKRAGLAEALVYLGGLVGAAAVLLPIMFYPFFFEARGEMLLATVPLSLIAYPFVAYGAVSILKDFAS